MNSMKTKKGKIAVSLFAVMLIACILTVSMTGCSSSEVGVTPVDVFFVGTMQKNPTDTSDLMKEGTELVSVKTMLDTEKWTLESHPYDVIAGIYALAVTNYNNVNRAAYMVMTDSSVNAFQCSNLGNKDVNVGIRSTYSNYRGENGYFEQTVSGVTVLDGLGGFISSLKSNFGWNSQVYQNDDFRIEKKGFNAGAEFYGEGNNDSDVTKYIMGAGNPKLNKVKAKDYRGDVTANLTKSEEDDFVSNRMFAWSELEAYDGDKLTVAGTTYYTGTYGTGWATSNYSNKEYFDEEKTSISYDADLDLYTLNITIINDYVDEACDFTKGGLVKDTKDYIALKNAKYIESTAKVEVYGSGLIKSMQKIDTLESKEKCDLTVAGGMLGSCNGGGRASNRITMAFGYEKEDCDALRLVALYWPELATDTSFQKAKNYNGSGSPLKGIKALDLSKYTTFKDYKPQINDLAGKFNTLYSYDWSTYSLDEE